ncbi:MAG: DUF1707 SHOCT-like domain-containing protein [Nocardioidaceae bacterium]
MSPNPEIRIGDAERDAAVSSLGEHFAAGRLTHEEYDERANVAFKARTQSDLRPLFADLPTPEPEASWWRGPQVAGRLPSDWRRAARGVPLLPAVLAILALTILLDLPLLPLMLIAWLCLCGPLRHRLRRW